MRVFLKTFGCSSNRAETASLEFLLKRQGFEIVDGCASAEAIVINTCTVRRDTELKVMRYISSIASKKVVVTGCMAEVQPSTISSAFPNASIISPHNLPLVAEALSNEGRTVIMEHSPQYIDPSPYGKGVKHFVAISRGCLGECTYCIVRLAKGTLTSVPQEKIIKSVASALDQGAREIYLSAQDTGIYGSDIGSDLPELLHSILHLKGDFMVRVGMFGPSSVSRFFNRFIQAYNSEKIYKFAHIPVQSGSDTILERMGRGYQVGDFRYVISSLRSNQPSMSIFTDIMVGFPGESEDDFAQTCELLEHVRPDKTHVARFSARPHTPASVMRQVQEELKKKRSIVLTKIVERIQSKKNSEWIGKVVSAIVVDYYKWGGMIARTDNYKTVALPGAGRELIGQRQDIAIRSATPYFLVGEISHH
jgi:MiaB-like tRNA modifying enzyme